MYSAARPPPGQGRGEGLGAQRDGGRNAARGAQAASGRDKGVAWAPQGVQCMYIRGWKWLPVDWPRGRAPREVREAWSRVRGPGCRRLGICPSGNTLPESPTGAPEAGRPHRGCAARGSTPASGGSGGGSPAPWSPWRRMRGTRGRCRAGGGALGPRYRYSAAPGSRLETRLCG